MNTISQIPLFKVFMSDTISDCLAPVLNSGFVTQGPKVAEFENSLKKYINSEYIVTTNSATSANHLALHLIKLFSGIYKDERNEVITTPLTCTATNWPILANGLDIKWADVNLSDLNIDLDDVYNKCDDKTLAVMLVYWAGSPIDHKKLKDIKLKIVKKIGYCPIFIHDCAHAFGAKINGNYIGDDTDFYFFSFQAIKHLTCGDGGALVCPNNMYFEKAKLLRWFGIDRNTNKKDYRCEEDVVNWGYKFHMNDIAATIGLCNMNNIDNILTSHKNNANKYSEHIVENKKVKKLKTCKDNVSSYWVYTMLVENRDNFMDYMKDNGIVVSQVHLRNDVHSCVNKYMRVLPNLDFVADKHVSIPVGWWLGDSEVTRIINSVNVWSLK